MAGSDEAKLRYSSSLNISMRGTIELGMTWDEWDELTKVEQEDIIQEQLNELVEVWPDR